MPKLIKQVAGVLTEEATIVTSAGAGDAGKVPHLDGNGLLATSFMPAGIGAETIALMASEALSAGDMVNIWNDAGTPKVRKADASGGIAKKADGFVIAAVASGASATVYYGNRNTGVTGLTGGTLYYLSATPGAVTATPPTTAGHIVQRVGKAYSATALLVNIEEPIVLA